MLSDKSETSSSEEEQKLDFQTKSAFQTPFMNAKLPTETPLTAHHSETSSMEESSFSQSEGGR